jgi:hypothetical protein
MSEQGEGEKPPGSLPVASHIHIHSRFHINHDPSTPRKPSSPASEEALDLDYAGSSEEIDPVHRHDCRQDEDKILSGAKDTTVRQEKESSFTAKSKAMDSARMGEVASYKDAVLRTISFKPWFPAGS